MPFGWTKVATPDELRERLPRPDEFEEKAKQLVEEAGATVGKIYWERHGGPAYVFTNVPDGNAEAIFSKLDERIGPTTRLYEKGHIPQHP
jgi:hypothetical protein